MHKLEHLGHHACATYQNNVFSLPVPLVEFETILLAAAPETTNVVATLIACAAQ